ncbi:zinc ribbon domain-containing protein [Micromonospora sp. LOL_014]|uniref:zinc ribbon domain-containing protein n=1 Tax=Micromonospora sp. LOL_014 TaxID=3345415 RepID=UPI003A8391CA
MVEYKAARAYVRRVDRWLPSTRMCSDCGRINERMALNVRSWVCPCGSLHDRDVNAAINIKAAGQADVNDRGARGRTGTRPGTAR